MIVTDLSVEQRITETNTVVVSRLAGSHIETPVLFKNGNSAVTMDFPHIRFEEWLENSTLTFVKSVNNISEKEVENFFVSPVKSSVKVKMKVKIGGTVPAIPINSEDIVFLDE